MSMVQVVASTRSKGRPCNACGAPLVWYRTKAGKPHPFDAAVQPEKADGLFGPREFVLIDAKYSHFATCPRADEFRKKA